MLSCPQMEEIKVSPAYNWFRSTVPLKRVSSIILDLDIYVYTYIDKTARLGRNGETNDAFKN